MATYICGIYRRYGICFIEHVDPVLNLIVSPQPFRAPQIIDIRHKSSECRRPVSVEISAHAVVNVIRPSVIVPLHGRISQVATALRIAKATLGT